VPPGWTAVFEMVDGVKLARPLPAGWDAGAVDRVDVEVSRSRLV
jgi:hypothetical protein